jgi:hypothetical protein
MSLISQLRVPTIIAVSIMPGSTPRTEIFVQIRICVESALKLRTVPQPYIRVYKCNQSRAVEMSTHIIMTWNNLEAPYRRTPCNSRGSWAGSLGLAARVPFATESTESLFASARMRFYGSSSNALLILLRVS